MIIYALMKGIRDNPPANFHGIVITPGERLAWENGHEENWSYEVDTEEGAIVLSDPVTYDTAENGTLE